MTYGGFMIDDEDCVRPLGNAFPEILVVKRPGQIEADQVLLNCDVELKMEVPVLDYVALK